MKPIVMSVEVIQHGEQNYSLSWQCDDARFHVWCDADGKVRPARDGKQIVYKNPPLAARRGEPQWFDTRLLNLTSKPCARMTSAALRAATENCLFEAARLKRSNQDADEQRQRRAMIRMERLREAGPALAEMLVKMLRTFGSSDTLSYEVRKALTDAGYYEDIT